jgi:hypothetical protein
VLVSLLFIDVSQGVDGKRVHISDDLSDVVDIPDPDGADGDASWEEWGKGIKKHAEIKPLDPENKEDSDFKQMVGRCCLTVSKPVSKAPMVSALEATI